MELKPGFTRSAVGYLPQDWTEATVKLLIDSEIVEKPLDGNHGNIHPKSGDFVDWGIPFVMANNVRNGQVDLVGCSFIRKEQADFLQKGFSVAGDVLLTHKATIGNTAVVGEIPFPYIMLTPQVTYYRVKDPRRLSNIYLRHFFDSSGFQKVLKALAGGGTRSYIGISAQHQLPVVFPPNVVEQRAIATALSDVDALIAGLERLIAKKRDIKQAAMQQLLTGQARLPGFIGQWDRHLVADLERQGLLKLGRGDVISKKDIDATPGDCPIYSSSVKNEGEFGRYGRFMFDEELITWSVDGGGDFFYRTKHQFSVTNVCGYMRADSNRLNYRYLAAQLQFEHGKKNFDYQSKAHPSVVRAEYLVPVPPLAEQAAIAIVLSDMDVDLAAYEARLAKTRALKQGMMQELLTGRTRLV
jgi:type I restriction enzyme S subunit